MTDREKLAALLMAVPPFPSVVFARGSGKRLFVADHIADHLLANGVVVREKGEWKYYRKQGIAVCTSCSFERKVDDNFGRAVACPNCGADMTGGDRRV